MTAVPDVRFSRVGKHLAVFEESWKADHHEAMALYAFQEFLAEAVGLFAMLSKQSRAFRLAVFAGLIPADPHTAESERGAFEQWLQTATDCDRQLLAFEGRFVTVEGSVEFRTAVAHARQFLAGWHPLALSTARGLRVRRLTPAEVDARTALVQAV